MSARLYRRTKVRRVEFLGFYQVIRKVARFTYQIAPLIKKATTYTTGIEKKFTRRNDYTAEDQSKQ